MHKTKKKHSANTKVVRRIRHHGSPPARQGQEKASESGSVYNDKSSLSNRRDELFASAAANMNAIFCGSPSAALGTPRQKTGHHESIGMDFYLYGFAPAFATLTVAMSGDRNHLNPFISLFPLALQHEELFHAIIALGFSCHESEGCGLSLKHPSSNVFYHRAWALKFLQRKLTPPFRQLDNVVLLTTVALIAVDGHLGDFDSFGVHCRGLKEMVRARGGLENFEMDPVLKGLIKQKISIHPKPNSPTVKARCEYESPLPPSQDVARKVQKPGHIFTSIPVGFAELPLPAQPGPVLLGVISRMSGWLDAFSHVWQGAATGCHKDLLLSYTPSKEVSEILDCLRGAHTDEWEPNTLCLCWALGLFASNIEGDLNFCNHHDQQKAKGRPGYSWYPKARSQLTTALIARMSSGMVNTDERNFLIWTAMVATDSWRVGQFLLPQGHTVLQTMLNRCEEARHWLTLECILKRFLWYDPIGARMKTCWEERIACGRLMPVEEEVLPDCLGPLSGSATLNESENTSQGYGPLY